jgi:predicted ATP-grasp superfamily ATP-dependent carboligase|tara:strand:- start:1704 stop:1988 length:285 start_codon:yes stop_codon:yes gene_type:complete
MNIGTMGTMAVQVRTTSDRGFSAEEHAARCADKIVSVADTAHPAIREQARAYKTQVASVVTGCIKDAVASDRTTVYNALNDAGHSDLADLIRRL